MGILQFLKLRHKQAHPTGSGEFIENISWWLWDDPHTPGMLTYDAFYEILEQALTQDERGWMVVNALSRIKRDRPPPRETIVKAKQLFTKMDKYLINARERQPGQFQRIIRHKWTRADVTGPMLNVLCAYINVLEIWGYPYRWRIIKDARDWEEAVLLETNGRPSHFFREADIREINGLPQEFSILVNGVGYGNERIGGGNWHFHYQDGGFDMRFVQHTDKKPPTIELN
jgi:hypothetical protein